MRQTLIIDLHDNFFGVTLVDINYNLISIIMQ